MTDICSREVEVQLVKDMLDTELRTRYFGSLAEKYSTNEKIIRMALVVVSVLTTGEVAVKYLAGFANDILLLGSAIATSLLAIAGLDSKVKIFSELSVQFGQISYEYDVIWRKFLFGEDVNF